MTGFKTAGMTKTGQGRTMPKTPDITKTGQDRTMPETPDLTDLETGHMTSRETRGLTDLETSDTTERRTDGRTDRGRIALHKLLTTKLSNKPGSFPGPLTSMIEDHRIESNHILILWILRSL